MHSICKLVVPPQTVQIALRTFFLVKWVPTVLEGATREKFFRHHTVKTRLRHYFLKLPDFSHSLWLERCFALCSLRFLTHASIPSIQSLLGRFPAACGGDGLFKGLVRPQLLPYRLSKVHCDLISPLPWVFKILWGIIVIPFIPVCCPCIILTFKENEIPVKSPVQKSDGR